jgi:hypothetical protein
MQMEQIVRDLQERVENLEDQMRDSIKIKPTTHLNEWDGKSCAAREFVSSRVFNVCNEDIGNDDYCPKHSNYIKKNGVLRNGDVRITGEGCLPRGYWATHDRWMLGMDICRGCFKDTRTHSEKKRHPDIIKSKNRTTPVQREGLNEYLPGDPRLVYISDGSDEEYED